MATKFGISGRIAGIIVLVAVASAAISGGMSVYISKKQFANYISSTDQKQVERLTSKSLDYYKQHGTLLELQDSIVTFRPNTALPPTEPPPAEAVDRKNSPVRFTITNLEGLIVADSRGGAIGRDWEATRGDLTRYPLKLENGELIGHIYLGSRLPPRPSKGGGMESAFGHQIRLQTILSALIAALLALTLGMLLTRRIVSPITALTGGIHQLAGGNFGIRIHPNGDKELYLLTEEFNLMAQHLQDNEENRRTLMANIAHEIRTPLTILRGELEAIQSGRIEASEEVVSCLIDEIIRLTRLVKDFETLSLAEGGGLGLTRQTLDVTEVMDSLLPLKLLMDQDGIEFQTRIEPEVAVVNADPQRLTQILINLLTNAIRNVGPGGAIVMDLSPTDNGVLIEIRDNGPGIHERDLERVFARFFSANHNSDSHSGGTGLGLAIAKSFVEAHGGRIWVRSKVGEETSFFFDIPNG